MIQISVNAQVQEAYKRLQAASISSKRFASDLVNSLAFGARQDLQAEIDKRLSVKPWTRRGILVKKSVAASPRASVYVAKEQAKYLFANVYGGRRGLKAFEGRLVSAGILKPSSRVVPVGIPLDSFGNPKPALLVRILQAVAPGAQPKRTKSGRLARTQYFAIRDGSAGELQPGIWEKKGPTLKGLMIFVDRTQYKARFPFEDIARASVRARLDGIVQHEFDRTMKRATAFT